MTQHDANSHKIIQFSEIPFNSANYEIILLFVGYPVRFSLIVFGQKNHNGLKATFTAEAAVLQSSVTQLNTDIGRLETTWNGLQEQHDRHAQLWHRVSGEGADAKQQQQSLRETFALQLREQEALADQLNKV